MADINPVLVKDKRINQITDQVDYAVYSGASQNTYQAFPATTASASNISFNVQVPSENIIVSRDVLITTVVNFTVAIKGLANTVVCPFNLGSNDALQAFPLNKLFTTSSATINNTNVSTNTQDVIDAILKQIPQEQLQKYQGMTPVFTDGAYKIYSDGDSGATNYALNAYKASSINNMFLPRGAHPIVVNNWWRNSGANNTLDLSSSGVNDTFYFNCSTTLTEPLMCLSPFLFGGDNTYNAQGLVGINSMNLVLNVDSSCKRFWSTKTSTLNYTVSLGNLTYPITGTASKQPFESTNLLLNFLSSQPTDLIKSKNCVAFSDYPRYIQNVNLTGLGAVGTTSTYTSQNIQLNQIPDKLFIFVRKPMSNQQPYDSATFFPIKNISVNFSNASGLLSSSSTQDLYQLSVSNGLCMNWLEWSGYALVQANNTVAGGASVVANTRVATGGGILVINPAKDLSLPGGYLSNGSLGQFSLQFTISVENNNANFVGVVPELVVIAQNSGVFVSQSGSSSIFTGVLSKQMVLDTVSNQEAFDSGEYDRLVGGLKMSSGLKAVPRPMKKMGGVMSAGVRSAGRKLDMMAM
jgi:hypothetical protein